jgi:flagellar biosynthesis GTPase FlhF
MGMPEEKKKIMTAVPDTKLVAVEDTSKTAFSGSDLSGGNLDKVREILFGSQIRSYEKRLARLEERVVKETSESREDLRKRFESLETYIKKELESLSDRVKTEERERSDADREMSRELKDTSRLLEKKLTQLDDNLIKTQRDFNQQLSDKSKHLADDIRQKYEELLGLINRETEELRIDKTDRSTLAALFTEVAMRLNNEFKIPGEE